jgi:hypothetical protein
MAEFHETNYGRRFFDGQLPELIKNLGDVAMELKRANDLKEKELQIGNLAGLADEFMEGKTGTFAGGMKFDPTKFEGTSTDKREKEISFFVQKILDVVEDNGVEIIMREPKGDSWDYKMMSDSKVRDQLHSRGIEIEYNQKDDEYILTAKDGCIKGNKDIENFISIILRSMIDLGQIMTIGDEAEMKMLRDSDVRNRLLKENINVYFINGVAKLKKVKV